MNSPEGKTRITVDIYGNSYKLMASSSSAYMKSVAQLVNDQMFHIARTFPRLDSQRIAVLASVNMADENLRLKEKIQELSKGQLDSSETREKHDKLQMSYNQLHQNNDNLQKNHENLQKNHDSLQASYEKLLQSHNELKREHETNLNQIREHADKMDAVNLDMMNITEQNGLLSEQISGLFLQVEKEREHGDSAREQLKQLQEQLRDQKEAVQGQLQHQKEQHSEQLHAQKEELLELARAEKDALQEQHASEKEDLLESFRRDKEELLESHNREKEELLEVHRRDKEEFLQQGGNQDEVLQQELAKVEFEYRALQEEYGKLQNEYNEWIELVELESPEK